MIKLTMSTMQSLSINCFVLVTCLNGGNRHPMAVTDHLFEGGSNRNISQ